MLDTCTFEVTGVPSSQILAPLSGVTDIVDHDTRVVKCQVGYVKNAVVKVYDERAFLRVGMPTFRYGHNFEIITQQDIRHNISELSDLFRVSFAKLRVFRCDGAFNLKMELPCGVYMDVCETTGAYKRAKYEKTGKHGGETLYYSLGPRKLVMYDKIKEARARKVLIPKGLEKAHLLRCEAQIYRVKYELRRELRGANLSESTFLNTLVDYWEAKFLELEKNRLTRALPLEDLNVRQFTDYSALKHWDSTGGRDYVLSWIDDMHVEGKIEPWKRDKFKRKIRSVYQSELYTEQHQVAQELEKKIAHAATTYRYSLIQDQAQQQEVQHGTRRFFLK